MTDFTAAFAEISLDPNDADAAKAEMAGLLRVVCPQPEANAHGFQFFTPDDVKYLDALFDRFGLVLRSSDRRFEDIPYVGEIWYRCVSTFGSFIEASDLWPAIFEKRLAEWKPGFADYLRAVMVDDREKSRELAAKLNIEMLNAVMPRHLTG